MFGMPAVEAFLKICLLKVQTQEHKRSVNPKT